MKRIIILLIAVLYFVGGVSVLVYGEDSIDYKKFTLEPLPGWTDKYASDNKGDKSFFMMARLVKDLKLSYLQAVELQNHFRDLTAAGSGAQEAFDKALGWVRTNKFESGVDPAKLKSAAFIVAVDVDDTLLQQYYKVWRKGRDYYDYKISFGKDKNGKDIYRGVSMAPGWELLFKTIRKLGGLVIIFSANADDVVWKIVNTVMIGDKKLSDYVDGVMSNSYLILQSKYEWVPKGRVGTPVTNPSKDLRFFDSGLSKVIIIDDNPKRIIQNVCLRLPKKYDADRYYTDKLEAGGYDKQLPEIAKEIQESVGYAKKHRVSFVQAYLPYTQLGRVALHWLVETGTFTRPKAVEYIRQNPDCVDRAF
ncbi:MAG: hypothetical protein GY940_45110 [bacterium]|nr:hypothetical protein [bacterium]